MKEKKDRKERIRLKRELKSQEQIRTPDHQQLQGNMDNKFMDYNFQKDIIKKKHMLDLMMQKKLNRRKKKIIKVYGKDMLAEMYLDLLNITEGEAIPRRILSPLSGRVPRQIKKGRYRKQDWNSDSTLPKEQNRTFKLNTASIFNSPHNKKVYSSRSRSNSRKKQLGNKIVKNDHGGITSAEDTRHETADSNARKNNKEDRRAFSTGVKTRNTKTLKPNATHKQTISPDEKYQNYRIHRKKIKSPINMLKALGIHKKHNLLDEVLKMYK